MPSNNFHATCVVLPKFNNAGLLIAGPSRSGKSSLALQLLDRGALLISDDQTLIQPGAEGLIATAPAGLRGMIEVSGYGILQLPEDKIADSTWLHLSITLAAPDQPIERLPEDLAQQVLMVPLRRIALHAHDPGAVAKIFAVLSYRLLDYAHV